MGRRRQIIRPNKACLLLLCRADERLSVSVLMSVCPPCLHIICALYMIHPKPVDPGRIGGFCVRRAQYARPNGRGSLWNTYVARPDPYRFPISRGARLSRTYMRFVSIVLPVFAFGAPAWACQCRNAQVHRRLDLSNPRCRETIPGEVKEMDALMLATGVVFFAMMFGYIKLCERL